MDTTPHGDGDVREARRPTDDQDRSPAPPDSGAATLHLDAAAAFFPDVLLPGDPDRARAIATAQLQRPRVFSERRGLLGYSGHLPGGGGVLVQSTGMGAPSAAIVCEELADLGARLLLRVGTCASIDPSLRLNDLLVVSEAIADNGACRALGEGDRSAADPDVVERLSTAAEATGRRVQTGACATVDLFYDPRAAGRYERLRQHGAVAVEMECAAVFAIARRHGLRAACLLAVTDELFAVERSRLEPDEIARAGEVLGEAAIRALTARR